ncbi:MAG: HlyD family efflux transporter periplasmic adaptor subunit [Planctomycetes bacterium]|nr:HlyD family efflux transporter periplasmic adaptor subunit [Planctomycetota bacterium]
MTTTSEPRTASDQDHLHALLALAARSANAAEFARGALPVLVARFASPCASLELRFPGRVFHERSGVEVGDPAFWTEPVERALTEALSEPKPHAHVFKTRDGAVELAILSAPVLDSKGASIGAMAVATPCTSRSEARLLVEELAALAALLGSCTDALHAPAPSEAGAPNRAPEIGRGAAQALRKAAEFGTPLELAFSITNNLRTKTGCDRVALARVRGTRLDMQCISGLDSVREDSPWVQSLRAALEESADHGARIVCQRKLVGAESDDLSTGHRLHRAWHAAAQGAAVATLPISMNGRVALVIGLQRAADKPFRVEELDEIAKLVEPYAPALELVEHARASLAAHVARRVREEARLLRTSRGVVRAALGAGVVALGAWLALGTAAWEITVPCRVRTAELRHVSAPFEGVLAHAAKRPGETVRAGEPIARFDTHALELESGRLAREIDVARVEERRAFASGTASDAELARARLAELLARRAEVDDRIARATIHAPFDGRVLSGDPAQRAGSVLAQGEPLYEIAPDERVVFDLRVPEPSLGALRVGATARFSPFAASESSQPLTVTEVAPASAVHDGRNVFVAEARADGDASQLRPGMEGVAVLEAGERRVAWIYGHRALDWMRLNLWP